MVLFFCFSGLSFSEDVAALSEQDGLFGTFEDKEEFALEVSALIESAWKRWQDHVVINDVHVNGSRGILVRGSINEPVLSVSDVLEDFDRADRSQDYIDCVRAVAGALENGVRNGVHPISYETRRFRRTINQYTEVLRHRSRARARARALWKPF